MSRFWISDTHVGHARIIDLCDRPYANVAEMNAALIENWNHVVGEDDTVFHLGDVALGPWVEWDGILSQLNGHKHLIIGNHDRMFDAKGDKLDRWYDEYEKWFESITFAGSVTLSDGTLVYMSHFPYNGDSHDGDRFEDRRLSDDGTILMHGHTHSNSVLSRSQSGTLQVHVGADAHSYRPVSEEQVINYIQMARDTSGTIDI